MTKKDIQEFSDNIGAKIDAGRVREAIYSLKSASEHAMLWEVTDILNNIERNYSFMLDYLLKGIDDPQRPTIYAGIVDKLLTCRDVITRQQQSIEAPTLYFNTMRVNSMHRKPLNVALQQHLNALADATPQMAASTAEEIFKLVWTAFPLGGEAATTLGSVLTDTAGRYPFYLRTMVLNALIMGQMEYFDNARMNLLLDTYTAFSAETSKASSTNGLIASMAVVGIYISLLRHNDRKLLHEIASRMKQLAEEDAWAADLRTVAVEWIRIMDTERINKKMRDELIPGFLKMRPDIMRKINLSEDQINSLHDLEGNPEWEEILRNSGIENTVRELSEIQHDGGDVFMASFAHLKQFPFFNNISAWFLPFSPDSPHIAAQNDEAAAKLASSLYDAPFLCDNDKYSFIMSLSVLPEQQRRLLQSQIDAQAENIAEASRTNEHTHPANVRRRNVRRHLQNLYRFFKLFRRKGEFFDPFASAVYPVDVPFVGEVITDGMTLSVLSEMYFKFGMYKQAYDMFERADKMLEPDATRYQKMGYCLERQGDAKAALDSYEKAELIGGESAWTTRRIATCARITRNYARAIRCFEALEQANPDDIDTSLLLGFVYTEAARYSDAIAKFRKVEFYRPESQQAWRSLAWTLFLTGDFEGSRKYYDKIISNGASTEDYLNMGHVELALNHMREAVNYYRLSIDSPGGNEDVFVKSLKSDRSALEKSGIDLSILPLIVDETLTIKHN